MTFTGTVHPCDSSAIRLELVGELGDGTTVALQRMILDVVVDSLPGELLLDLDGVTVLGRDAVIALVSGYAAAIECGVVYRVVNAHRQPLATMQATGTLEVLANSEDIGALLVAVLIRPRARR